MATVSKLNIDDYAYDIEDSKARHYMENGGVYIDPNEEEPEVPDIPDTPGGGGGSGETPSASDISYDDYMVGDTIGVDNIQDAIDYFKIYIENEEDNNRRRDRIQFKF